MVTTRILVEIQMEKTIVMKSQMEIRMCYWKQEKGGNSYKVANMGLIPGLGEFHMPQG